jgi:hypothetical protein
MKRVVVFYTRDLKIQSIVATLDQPGAPPAGVLPVEGCDSVTIELSDEQAERPLIELHTRYRLELGDRPRLVSVEEDRRPWRGAGELITEPERRFEVTVHGGTKQLALDAIADFDLDRVPDPAGGVRLLVTAEQAADLVERGYEVHLVQAHPVRPLDATLTMDDKTATAWLEEQVRDIERNEGS